MATKKLLILDYGSGNLRSAAKSFEKVISDHAMDFDVVVSDQVKDLEAASHIVLPGQGAFGDCMAGLTNSGLIDSMEVQVLQKGKPFLGICVGMQLLASRGVEGGMHAGLGWIEGEVVPLSPDDPSLKIPHMGWNTLMFPSANAEQDNRHFIMRHVDEAAHFYFVHSYAFKVRSMHHALAFCEYGELICAAVGRDNMIGVQFHPEKSADDGLKLLGDFLLWKP